MGVSDGLHFALRLPGKSIKNIKTDVEQRSQLNGEDVSL